MKRLALIAFFTAFGLWGAMTLGWPHGLDQGIFAWVGSVILDGGVPYKDAWEIKGPLTHVVYALAQALLGHNEWGIRVLDALMLAVGICAAYRAGRTLSNALGGLCAAVSFFGLYGGTGYWHTAQPDGWFASGLLVVLALGTRPDFAERGGTLAVTGLILGAAVMLKPLYVIFLAPVAVAILLRAAGGCQPSVRPLGILAGAFAVPVVAALVWLACHAGGLQAFAEVQFHFNLSVHAAETSAGKLQAVSLFVLYTPTILLCLPVFVLGMATVFGHDRATGVLFLGTLLLAILSVVLQAKYYSYHWHPVRAVYALTSGVGLGALRELWQQARERGDHAAARPLAVLTVTFAVLVMGLPLRRPVRDVVKWGTAVAGLRPWEVYYEQVGGPGEGNMSYLANKAVADYVAGRTSPDEPVLVWGFSPLINYLAKRRSPSRFGFNHALTRGPSNPLEAHYRRIYLDDLAANPPVYIIMSDKDQHALLARSSKALLEEFPELKTLIDRNYRLETTVAGFELWRRVK